MSEVYPASQYHYTSTENQSNSFGSENHPGIQSKNPQSGNPNEELGSLKVANTDKKTRFAPSLTTHHSGGTSPVNQSYTSAPAYSSHQNASPDQNQQQNSMAAMAAMLGQMQQQQQQQQQQTGQSAGYNQLQAAMNGVGISSSLAGVNGYGQQNSAFLTSPHLAQFASPNVAQFSPNLAISNGGLSAVQTNFPSPLLGAFPSPNSAGYANFPSPGLSQTSYGTMPSAQNGTFSPGLVSGLSQSGAINGQTGRTVYVGNLPADAAVDELLSQVRFGPIDTVKVLPEKNCAFISFLDPTTAAAFHSDALMRKIQLHGQELKIGWGKPSAVPTNVVMAVQQNGATRNVYLGNLEETATEQSLRDDLSRFGPIDQVKIVRDKNIGFVHFLSIATAIKVVQALAVEPAWAGKRVHYGKDRCAYVPKNQHQQQQHNMAAAAMAATAAGYVGFSNTLAGINLDPTQVQPGNRTVYLGNIHPETTLEEICNTIRGGILQQIRYIQDKHIAFVTFVDANAAVAFYHTATFQGVALHNRRLKVGWGKHSGPPSPGIAMVVQAGGSRNVYIGQIDDFEAFDEARIRHDFSQYGEIELVNLLKEKNCAFVNFTNIANSIKAIEGIKQNEDYAKFKIAYGKDRCANAPRNAPWSQLFSPVTPTSGVAAGPRSAPAHMTGFSNPIARNSSSGIHSAGFSPNPTAEDFANIVVTAEGGSVHASPEVPQPET
ncbi:hypothetical protein BY996DRAFT_8496877 [Phakopsora pachyrhizi]|uniref:RRM domain-containing protein n=1 Tax=Phakopsora pachyrhizi TaxID=170000 RepID=A0AAV0BI92_PHAPC|nr:hypothetical protein BY996DRAFT_8496877 [Phakopsora pachyrhizi]CAH7686290.1 hypothetical protein PPACK8108_LOCUS20921 [Phakopsora pachyrhizi]